MSPEEILKKALELEREAIRVYSEMRKNATSETADILDYLISQEKEHIKIISDRLKVIRFLSKHQNDLGNSY